jgi:hypothetical protein
MLRNDRDGDGVDSDPNTYAHAYAITYADGDAHADSHTYAHGHTDAVHWKMFTDAEAGSDSGAASHATCSHS